MHIHLTYHILIHMLIHISYISFTHAYTYFIHIIYTCLCISHTYLSYHISFLIIVHIHFVSFYTLLLVLVIVYLSSHSSDMLLISFHIMSFIIFKSFAYSCHLFFCFMPAYALGVDTGNYKGPKTLLSLYETMTSIRARSRCYHCMRQ